MWEVALKVVQDEEEVKQKLCEDLNQLVYFTFHVLDYVDICHIS